MTEKGWHRAFEVARGGHTVFAGMRNLDRGGELREVTSKEKPPSTIASLCRQTAAFRPAQKCTLLEQANEWERRAISELEGYFAIRDGGSRWDVAAAS